MSDKAKHSHRKRSKSHRRDRDRGSHSRSGSLDLMQQTLGTILTRLNNIENQQNSSGGSACIDGDAVAAVASVPQRTLERSTTPPLELPSCVNESVTDKSYSGTSNANDNDPSIPLGFEASSSMQAIVDAIRAVNPVRSNNYYVSNFDPVVHNFDTWCKEVESAKIINSWNDHECLSRVASCLKGDAKVWLNEWVTNDRTWPNFRQEFSALCPNRLDHANILFEVMSTSSDRYATYAEYARRSLLKLRIVNGLSDDLMIQIIIRGIADPQIRATATNANLTPETIISFLAIYIKPKTTQRKDLHVNSNSFSSRKRQLPTSNDFSNVKCFTCGGSGHKQANCFKKSRTDAVPDGKTRPVCSFCKKLGHTGDHCFAKDRSANDNKKKVNLCSDRSNISSSADITSAVVQGIPVDVLIDSGALNVSLISSNILKYFSYNLKPICCTLKGIGAKEIVADSYVTLTIEFCKISIEVDLVVVPTDYIPVPIIIGTDVLNRDGVTYIRTKNGQYLTRSTDNLIGVHSVSVLENPLKTPLVGTEREALDLVISDFSDFLITGTANTTVTTGEMHIELTSQDPIAYRPYKLSYHEKLKVREIISDLKDKGIIRESESAYSSPIILVKKKDGSDRMCVDFRALNRITVRDRYPLPLIDDHIDRLGNFKFFTSLDMATGFHQIRLNEGSIPKTGFVTPEGHFEYLKMPYGLTNSPVVYQRIINKTLQNFIESGETLVYIDDVLLMSQTVYEGIALLRKVLKTLTDAGFSINLRKCSFLTTEIEYLGRKVSKGQVRPSPHKVEALRDSPKPENVKQVRQFLGLAGYFRRYIHNYATKTACIARLTKKNTKFEWGNEQEEVRQELISVLTSAPILSIFDTNRKTEVHTDASSIGYGAVLIQIDNEGMKHVVGYFSRATQGAESKYHSYELETLAVVKALQHYRHYLVGIEFKIVTDCNALKSTERKKDLLPRVARWWIYLQDFNFTIEYRKGSMMSHADYLSRNPVRSVNHIDKPKNWAQIAQAADNETQKLLERLGDGQLDPNRYVHKNDLLYYRYSPVGQDARLLCYVPKGHRLSLLRIFHDEHQHVGVDKTLDLILKHFWFPGLRQFVVKYVAHCLVCVSCKRVPRAPHQPITSWDKPEIPFSVIHADALGPLPVSNGNKFILVVVDSFTKYCLLYPMNKQDSSELKQAMMSAISLFGTPRLLVADRGRMFESSNFVNWLTELGTDMHYITPEMHHANGQAERYIRTVLNMIRIEVNHKRGSWSESLWKLQLILNTTKQKTTQVSALNLMVGIDGTTPVLRALVRDISIEDSEHNREARRELCRSRAKELLDRNQARQDLYVNQRRNTPRIFNVGDSVFVIKYSQSTGKLDPGMRGPYKVLKVLPSDRYELKLISGAYGKTTQAAAQYMVPWRGEWCPETCAAFFENDSENDDMLAEGVPPQAEGLEGIPGPSSRGDGALNAAPTTSRATQDFEDSVRDEPLSGEAV